MKKILLAGAIALTGLVNAQRTAVAVARVVVTDGFEGRTFVSGNLGYNSEMDNNTDSEDRTFSITPVIGYFVSPTVAIGAGIGYESNVMEVADKEVSDTGVFVFTPMARKYWALGNRLYAFGQLAVPMAWGKDNISDVKVSSYGVNLAPGLDYMITDNWSLETTIGSFGYQTTKADYDDAESNDNFDFGVNLQDVKFGVKYIF